MITIGTARRPIVRVKSSWTDAWTIVPRGSYSISRISETAGCTIDTERVSAFNREDGAAYDPGIAVDDIVQVGAEDPELTSDNANRIQWLWMGTVTACSYTHEGYEASGREVSLIVRLRFAVEPLSAWLYSIPVERTRVIDHTGAGSVLQRCLDFNPDGIGNRAATAEGDGTFAHHQAAGAPRWTAATALARILADHINATETPTMPTLQLSGQLAALDYAGSWSVHGQSIGDVLDTMVGGSRGATWALEPDMATTGPLPIRITSTLLAPVSIPSSGDIPAVALPACDRQVALLDTGDSHWRVASTISARPRRCVLEGTHRITMSLVWRQGTATAYDALARGWSAADSFAGDPDPRYADVLRRFVLRSDWSGLVAAGVGLPTGHVQDSSGPTGAMDRSAAGFAVGSCRLDPDMVVAQVAQTAGGDPASITTWAGDGTATMPTAFPRDQVRLWIHNGTTATEYTDSFQVSVVNDPLPTVIIGTGPEDALQIKAALGTSTDARIIVTLTVVGPLPILVGRTPAGATAGRRIQTGHQVHEVLGQTWFDGAPLAAGRVVRDDRPLMRSLLAGLGPYLDRIGSASIANRLLLFQHSDALRLGAMVVAYHDGREDEPIDMRAVIVDRAWDFAPGSYGTYLKLAPPTISLEQFT